LREGGRERGKGEGGEGNSPVSETQVVCWLEASQTMKEKNHSN
jgi:hypothetical protein